MSERVSSFTWLADSCADNPRCPKTEKACPDFGLTRHALLPKQVQPGEWSFHGVVRRDEEARGKDTCLRLGWIFRP